MTKIGINGFGRIGRLAFRAAINRKDIEIVGINDIVDPEYMAYMLKYDSTHNKFDGTVEVKDGHLVVYGKKIRVTAEKDPADLKWGENGAESIAVLGSARATNEENYVAQKFVRVVLGTNNVDCCARVCHTPTAAAMKMMLGTGAATNSFTDIEMTETILVCGANPTENHPIPGARIKQAVKALDHATQTFAQRRMDENIRKALAGHKLDEFDVSREKSPS